MRISDWSSDVCSSDLPTGGVIVDGPEAIAHAYATGKGAFRVRAKWETEDQGRGTWTAVISEIPFQVQKGKLIEQIAALIAEKKLPILADVRDESDEAIRIVLEPRSRKVEDRKRVGEGRRWSGSDDFVGVRSIKKKKQQKKKN